MHLNFAILWITMNLEVFPGIAQFCHLSQFIYINTFNYIGICLSAPAYIFTPAYTSTTSPAYSWTAHNSITCHRYIFKWFIHFYTSSTCKLCFNYALFTCVWLIACKFTLMLVSYVSMACKLCFNCVCIYSCLRCYVQIVMHMLFVWLCSNGLCLWNLYVQNLS